MGVIIVLLFSIEFKPIYFTNYDYIYDITGKDSLIYCATNGGIVKYNRLIDEFNVLTSRDGLPVNRQSCIALDSSGLIWTGNAEGYGLCLINDDFTSAQRYPIDCITCAYISIINCSRDTVYIGTTGGLTRIIINATPDDFNDDLTFRVYPEDLGLSNVITAICTDDSSVWVGTNSGLARYDKSFSQAVSYNINNTVTSICIVDTQIYVGAKPGLFRFSGDHFDTLLSNIIINDIAQAGDSLLLAMDSSRQIGLYYQGTYTNIKNGLPLLTKVNSLLVIDTMWFCGLGNSKSLDYYGEGIGAYDRQNARWQLITGNCIGSNHISCITANTEGVFVTHGNRSSLSRGFSWLKNNGEWARFTRDSIVPANNVHRCVTAPDGRVWFGVLCVEYWSGIGDLVMAFSLKPTTGEWIYLPNQYLNMDSTDGLWDIEIDKHNNLFLSMASQTSDRCWIVDSALTEVYVLEPQKEGWFCETAIDSNGKIWRTIVEQPGGLVVTDTKNTLFQTADDSYHEYDMPGNITKNLRGCVVDGNNNLYIASPVGLIKYDGISFTSIAAFASLDLFDTELDALGRIWIMGRDGIYVYEPQTGITDGVQYRDMGINIDFGYLDKEVIQTQGFEYDPLRRCFWLGGETGLLKLEISIDTFLNLDDILIYPNPVVNYDRIHIKNLPPDARVNIYSITGRILAKNLEPDNNYGEVIWTIPDDVRSGLYFALIKSQYGRKVCKFTVIK